MTISRGQMPRQLYGLGSLVKSITKGVKKIAKSPIGKIGLAALATVPFGGPAAVFNTAGSYFGKGSFNPFLKDIVTGAVEGASRGPGLSKFGQLANRFGLITGEGNLTGISKILGLGIPSLLAAGQVPKVEGFGGKDKEALARYLRRYYSNLNRQREGESDEEYEARVSDFVRTNMARGGDTAEENAIQASGIMGLPLNENPAGVTELDLRKTGGFIPPVGVKEKADDIPAMLSNNEFVFTADAVRGMGGGDVDKGAERMYAMMKTLENGGRV